MIHSQHKLTPVQYARTLTLAAAHNHAWAAVMDLTPYGPQEGWVQPHADSPDLWCHPDEADTIHRYLSQFDLTGPVPTIPVTAWKNPCLAPAMLATFPPVVPGTVSPWDIDRRVRALRTAWKTGALASVRVFGHTGITAPTLDTGRNIVHATASGRTGWCVTREGQVTVRITRPAPIGVAADDVAATVLVGYVTPEGGVTVTWFGTYEYHRRHLRALRRALLAVADVEAVRQALRPLAASLGPAPEPLDPSAPEVFLDLKDL